MKGNPLYFIALLPPAALQREVTELKRYIEQQWGPRHGLKSPPHITLQPPFEWPPQRLPALLSALEAFAGSQTPFPVHLRGFGAFPPRVIFIRPLEDESLESLFRELTAHLKYALGFEDPRNNRPFHPHMTLAHRDLEARDFPGIWAHFREQAFERDFTPEGLTLLEAVSGGGWEPRKVFPFAV